VESLKAQSSLFGTLNKPRKDRRFKIEPYGNQWRVRDSQTRLLMTFWGIGKGKYAKSTARAIAASWEALMGEIERIQHDKTTGETKRETIGATLFETPLSSHLL
jgi:hypothetical protein